MILTAFPLQQLRVCA